MPCSPYEYHEMHYTASRARRWPGAIRLHLAAIIFLCFPSNSLAAPTKADPQVQSQVRDSGDNSNTNVGPRIWASILAVAIIFFVLFAWAYSKRIIRRFSGRPSILRGSAPSSSNNREFTADQLAGSINRNEANANNNTANGRPRRTRRPRRTPSQISTASLPAYMKDPGEHELVIFRAPGDLQDMPQPSATVMSSVEEDGEEAAVPMTQSSRHSPMLSSTSDIPLLNRDGTATRGSISSDGSESSHGVNSSNNNSPDPRGEAPSYDEATRVLPIPSPPLQEVNLTETPPTLAEPPRTLRMSGFRSFLNAMSPTRPSPLNQPSDLRLGHRRIDSNNSDNSSGASLSQLPSRPSHRPSPSAGSFFRTLSRQRSMRSITSSHLNSPSVISINSISAPLTHTVVRTEITYPRSGPTPQQIRAISSREAAGRFGVPYGADAIAYVASTSRQDLPPGFDAVASTADLLPQSEASPSSVPESPPSSAATTATTEVAVGSGDSPLPPVVAELGTILQAPNDEPSGEGLTDESQSPIELMNTNSTTETSLSLSSGNIDNLVSSKRSVVPPSSFHAPPTEFGLRSESRASTYSMQSYATAADSLSARIHQDTSLSPPDTPKLGIQHISEPSNVSTIRLTTQPSGSSSSFTTSSP